MTEVQQVQQPIIDLKETHHGYGDTGRFIDLLYRLKKSYGDDQSKPHRLLTLTGSVKLHGTNMSFYCYKNDKGEYIITCQSRNNIIIAGSNPKDNYGYAHYIKDNYSIYVQLSILLAEKYDIDLQFNKIIIYGEFCGKGIQTKVALAQMPRQFVMFAVCVINIESNITSWLNINKVYTTEENKCIFSHFVNSQLSKIKDNPLFYNIFDFNTYEITIDTAQITNPEYIDGLTRKCTEYVDKIEKECPFSNAFGIKGIGEGVVFEHIENGYRRIFKCKGTEHVGVKRISTKQSSDGSTEFFKTFLEECINLRFEQACENVYTTENIDKKIAQGTRETPSIKDIRLLIIWINADIIKEGLKEYSDAVVIHKITPDKIFASTKMTSKLISSLIHDKCT